MPHGTLLWGLLLFPIKHRGNWGTLHCGHLAVQHESEPGSEPDSIAAASKTSPVLRQSLHPWEMRSYATRPPTTQKDFPNDPLGSGSYGKATMMWQLLRRSHRCSFLKGKHWVVRASLALQGGWRARVTAPLARCLSGPKHHHWTFRRRCEKNLLPHGPLSTLGKQPDATSTLLDAQVLDTSLPSDGSLQRHLKVTEQGWSRAGCRAASQPQSHPPLCLVTLVFALQTLVIYLVRATTHFPNDRDITGVLYFSHRSSLYLIKKNRQRAKRQDS